MDRTHVLATSHMDRHAAYVGLSRHRERVDLHWSADQVGSRERLARVLGRERLKDTSLDYGFGRTEAEREIPAESRESVRAYAERRGLVPESEIVLHERQAAVSLERAASAPRRSKFAGLKLNTASMGPVRTRQPSELPTGRQWSRRCRARWGSLPRRRRMPHGWCGRSCRCCRTSRQPWRRVWWRSRRHGQGSDPLRCGGDAHRATWTDHRGGRGCGRTRGRDSRARHRTAVAFLSTERRSLKIVRRPRTKGFPS